MYPEKDEMGTGKDGEVKQLVYTPGLSLLGTIGNGPWRDLYYATNGVLYGVSGNTLYTINSSWSATSIGTLVTTTGPVDMQDNGLQIFIVDGANGYWSTLGSSSLTQVTDPNWLGSNMVNYQDGYFIFVAPNSKEFYLSDLNAPTFVAPANTAKNGYPDNVIGSTVSNRNFWLLGDETTEVWFDSGNNLTPFQYIQGSMSQIGCAATFSVVNMGNTIIWLGKDQNGTGMIYQANGYQPQRISTHAVELAIQNYSTISDAIGFSYQESGHYFYFLTFPTASATWCYDMTTQLWHERAYLSNGTFQRHRANCQAFAYGMNIVGDYSNGNLYQMTSNVYSDNGNAIPRQRVAPHISKDMNRLIHSKFQLDFEPGIGIDGSGQGVNPQVILEWSNDGGKTWSNQHWTSLGAEGTTNTRAIWRRLGQGRNRVYRVTITDPVKVVMIGAEIEIEECDS